MNHAPRINRLIGFLAQVLNLIVPVAESKTATGHYLDRCTSGLDWIGTGFKSEDCSDAVRALQETDARVHLHNPIEFLAPNAIPTQHDIPSKKTPIKYVHGK
jgi:hypothetical protein